MSLYVKGVTLCPAPLPPPTPHSPPFSPSYIGHILLGASCYDTGTKQSDMGGEGGGEGGPEAYFVRGRALLLEHRSETP